MNRITLTQRVKTMQKIGDKIQVIVPDEMKNEVNRIAKRHELSQSAAARKLMELGLEFYQEFEKIGVPQTVEMIKKVKRLIRDLKQRRIA
ncbi:MAG: hypothetical protein WC623_24785 [Pedobacter sp.]|uniref:hypothetical protein n=1 Tax=Pedobacter sp. TaxID=1411316 RepID=UPI003565D6EB